MKNDITIRPVTVADAPAVQKYVGDNRVADTCNVPYPYPEDGAITWTRKVVDERDRGLRYPFAMECDGEFAGVVDLELVGRPEGTAELGYWVPPHQWNRGIATDVRRQIIAYGFEVVGLSCLTSACLARNPASGRVLEKNGFQETGTWTETNRRSRSFGEKWRLFRLNRKRWEQTRCEQHAGGYRR